MSGILVLVILIIFLSPVFLFFKFVKGKVNKQKKSSWEGKLVDKKHLEYEDDDSPYPKDLYTLYFETTGGKKIKINVAKNVYADWNVGDQAKKIEGQLLPGRTS
ncbi:MAG: hypothetical protein Q8N84_01285 [bacterium]|nr:hypothetical protein [bacterium]